jgi:hypothetical protein
MVLNGRLIVNAVKSMFKEAARAYFKLLPQNLFGGSENYDKSQSE